MRLSRLFIQVLFFTLLTSLAHAQVQSSVSKEGSTDLYFYIYLVIAGCLLSLVISKIFSLYEASRALEGKNAIDWGKILGAMLIVFLVTGLYGVYWSFKVHGSMILPESASEHGKSLDFLLSLTTVLIIIPFVLTQILLLSFPYLYRERKNRKALFYPDNHLLERGWAGIISVVLIVLVGWGFYIWNNIMVLSDDDTENIIHVNVTGEQYKWTIRYAGEDNIFGATSYKRISPDNGLGIDFEDERALDDRLAGEIVLPVDVPVRVKINSKDVLHSFYLPHFRVQMNAVPGMDNFFQFVPTITTQEMRERLKDPTFDYVLLCAKICGGGHYNMQSKVRIVSLDEYQAWIKDQSFF